MGGELEEDWVWEGRRDDGRRVNGDGMSVVGWAVTAGRRDSSLHSNLSPSIYASPPRPSSSKLSGLHNFRHDFTAVSCQKKQLLLVVS